MNDISQKPSAKPHDPADHLRDDKEALLYLQACMAEPDSDARFIAYAIGTVARARSKWSQIAQSTNLSRESLYKAFSGDREPTLSTILKVLNSIGLKLSVEAIESPSEDDRHFISTQSSTTPFVSSYVTNEDDSRINPFVITPAPNNLRSMPAIVLMQASHALGMTQGSEETDDHYEIVEHGSASGRVFELGCVSGLNNTIPQASLASPISAFPQHFSDTFKAHEHACH